jgi:hypothetical protein
MPVPVGVEHREAPERLPEAAKTPWELRISRRSAGPQVGETPWGAGSKRHGSPRCRGLKRARGPAGAKASATAVDDVLRRGLGGSGTTAVEPELAGSSALESTELSTSYSSEFEAVEHRGREGAAGAAMHHGLPVRKSVTSENPMSGSGPSGSARPEREQTVEGVKDPEDGRCRAGKPGYYGSLRRCR